MKVSVPSASMRLGSEPALKVSSPVAVHCPRWLAVPEAVRLPPVGGGPPVKARLPVPCKLKGRSTAAVGRDHSSRKIASMRMRALRQRCIGALLLLHHRFTLRWTVVHLGFCVWNRGHLRPSDITSCLAAVRPRRAEAETCLPLVTSILYPPYLWGTRSNKHGWH